ncbi:uncharacterized protein Su(s)_5 isoform X2 [Zeugodacus cucurbitae]|uniref:Protein suppressor of sable n=1 Tax=Zeugodacus cucurbitae TaxID=28588 RepID=A0A0A1WLP5_ZEUCU|nr:uncharacterized protein Su(s)_5 isoform X2 [Zeugodacus cucurbitae]
MPARSSDGKIVEKLRARKPAQICKKRPTRVVPKRQMQRSRGVIVTMSVEQSGGISLNTPECVATSHSRKISTTSALFSPTGVSIGVLCESTENKEVIVDMKNCSQDNANIAMDLNNLSPEMKIPLKTKSKSLACELRNVLHFLDDQQLEKLSEIKIKNIQQLLNIPLRKLLEIKLSKDQIQLLLALVEKEIQVDSVAPEFTPEEVQPMRVIAEEFQKLDSIDDDDDEKPLVIDESLHIIYENKNVSNIEERSLDAIEDCFSKIRNVKVPQARAALQEVRTELTEIIAELSRKENRILDNMSNNKNVVKTAGTEEAVTTTSKILQTSPLHSILQPTVLIRKLPTPLKKKELNVDADSTTSLDLNSSNVNKVETIADAAESKKPEPMPLQKKGRKRNIKVMNLVDDKDGLDIAGAPPSEVSVADLPSKVSENKSPSSESLLINQTSNIIESKKFQDSGLVSDDSMNANVQELTNHLDTSDNDLETNISLNSYCEAKRRIQFDAKPCDEDSRRNSSNDADKLVTITNTPLSPISNEIMSPIKANSLISNYKPALEIDGQCAGMVYLVKEMDLTNVSINKPHNLDLLLRSNTTDPRLLKYLKKENSTAPCSTTLCGISKVVQSDPRRSTSIYNAEKFQNQRTQESTQSTPNMLLYGCLQRSPWYQSLMSTMKIQINQTISILVRAINNFQKIRLDDPYAVFDIFKLYCAGELLEILENLGLFVDVNGVISEKKNMSSYAGRSYGCASVVNATYSFIQPVDPHSVTVQQQMRSYTSPASNFVASPTTFQPSAPFISCYVDSPQMAMDKPTQLPQPYMFRPKPSPYRAPLPPRRHCGLKVPYSSKAALTRSSLSPIKPQPRCSDSEEENWDLDDDDIKSSTPIKPSLSPSSASDCDQRSPKYEKSYGNENKRY